MIINLIMYIIIALITTKAIRFIDNKYSPEKDRFSKTDCLVLGLIWPLTGIIIIVVFLYIGYMALGDKLLGEDDDTN